MSDQAFSAQVTYDSSGRMAYHPDFHEKQGTPWSMVDQKFLIDNYEALGPEQVSFELGRTIGTVMTRVYKLRKRGQMPKRTSKLRHHRVKRGDS